MHSYAARTIRGVAIAAILISPALVHAALLISRWTPLAVCLITVQIFIVCALILWRSNNRYKWLLAIAIPGLVAFALSRATPQQSLIAMSGIPHAAVYLGLSVYFGQSLAGPQDAVITVLARRVRGNLPAYVLAYTRQVTWAWCIFFAGQVLTSLILLLCAPVAIWSLFVNLLNYPLVALMFVAEYAFRTWHLRDQPRDKISHIWQMFAPAKNTGE